MKTKSLSIFLVALFVVGMNLGAEEDKNENKEGGNFEYEIMKGSIPVFDFSSFKMILIGNDKVGKSALCNKICKNEFSENYVATAGLELNYLYFKIKNTSNEPVLRYQIYDCCGQGIYRSLITNFYKDTKFFLLAYDVTNDESFNDIDGWVNEVKAHNTDEHIHFVLIGTKIDLEDKRVVSKEAGEKFAEENGMKFVEVSAKTSDGIKKLEYILAKIIYEEFKKDKDPKKKVKDENDEKRNEIKLEYDIEVDLIGGKKSTHSSSLCDCCKEICDNC